MQQTLTPKMVLLYEHCGSYAKCSYNHTVYMVH